MGVFIRFIIDPKFDNPKCWSDVFVRAPQARAASAENASLEGGGGGRGVCGHAALEIFEN